MVKPTGISRRPAASVIDDRTRAIHAVSTRNTGVRVGTFDSNIDLGEFRWKFHVVLRLILRHFWRGRSGRSR